MKNRNLHCQDCPVKDKGPLHTLNCWQLEEMDKVKVANIYHRGQVIYYEDNPAFGIHIVVQGLVKLYSINRDGKSQIVRIAKAGDLMGYRAVLAEEPYCLNAEALTDTIICFLDKASVLDFIRTNQEVALGILKEMAQQLGQTQHLVSDLAHGSVRERVAKLLISLNAEFGEETLKGSRLNIHLSRDELASCVGTSTETLVRVLSEFDHDGMVQKSGSNIILLDIKELHRLSAN